MKFPDSGELPSPVFGRGPGPPLPEGSELTSPPFPFSGFVGQRVRSFDLEATYTLPYSQEAVP